MLTWLKNLFTSRQAPNAMKGRAIVAIEESLMQHSPTGGNMSYKLQGDAYLKQGKLTHAAQSYRQSLALEPHDAKVHRTLGMILKEQGNLTEAEHYLRGALTLDPAMGDAHHALGVIFQTQGRLDESICQYQKAVDTSPELAIAYRDLAYALVQQEKFEDAKRILAAGMKHHPDFADLPNFLGNVHMLEGQHEQSLAYYRQAVSIQPDFADAQYNHGIALQYLSRHEEARSSFEQVLQLKPDHVETLNKLGVTLRALQQFEEALACFDKALQFKQNYVEALNNRGSTLQDLRRFEEALACHELALQFGSDHANTWYNRGVALHALKRYEEALIDFERALQFNQDNIDGLNNRCIVLYSLNRHEEAIACCDHILRLDPNHFGAYLMKGNALRCLNKHVASLANYDRMLQIAPTHAEALNDRGNTLTSLNRLEEALTSFRHAQQPKSSAAYPDPHYNEGIVQLMSGNFTIGWQKYEFRWRVGQFKAAYREFAQPLWLGQDPIRGKTLLLHAEQGLGDTIQFCRYAKLAADQGAIVLLEVQPALTSLLADLDGVHMIYAKGEPLPPFDYHCPLLSLPLAFNTKLDSIPANVPYLHADPDRLTLWRTRLGHSTLPRIGVVWSGNPIHMNDRNRSIPLNDFSRIVFPQAQFISLHKEIRESDRALLNQRHDILCLDGAIEDFADTAALVGLMDLVITVDTSVAHLAGAMGKPVWLLLPFNPDWRWLLDRSDSPWYPTARLFRQPQIDDWDSVLTTVAIEAQHFIHVAANRHRIM